MNKERNKLENKWREEFKATYIFKDNEIGWVYFQQAKRSSQVEFEKEQECWLISMKIKDDEVIELRKEIKLLKAQLTRAIEVIKFYGDERNWGEDGIDEDDHDQFYDSTFEEYEDGIGKGGKRAREFLAELKEKKNDSD